MSNFDQYYDEFKNNMRQLIAIHSIASSGNEKNRYGEECGRALNLILNIAKKMGFKTFCAPGNAYGYIDYYDNIGLKQKTCGIYCHLDVVPPGDIEKWNSNPFVLTESDGKWYGRGVLDSKAPTLINLYAMYELKRKNIILENNVRLVIGLTEETDWQSIIDYKQEELIPDFGYTPDAKFPVVYAEKHLLNLDLSVRQENFLNLTVSSPTVYNMVCGQLDFEYKGQKGCIKGVSVHGAHPEKGISAIKLLCEKREMVDWSRLLLISFLQRNLVNKEWNELLAKYGDVTVNYGFLEISETQQRLGLNIRLDSANDLDSFVQELRWYCQELMVNLDVVKKSPGMYLDPNGAYIQTYLQVYRQVSKDEGAVPLTMGGGSYARAFPNAVAFGPVFDPNVGTAHETNEFIPIKWIYWAFDIYCQIIKKLNYKNNN